MTVSTVSSKCIFKAANHGISKKTGKPYNTVKVLDDEADEFITFFVDDELFQVCQFLEKNTPVCLTIELVVSSRFAKLISVEVIAD